MTLGWKVDEELGGNEGSAKGRRRVYEEEEASRRGKWDICWFIMVEERLHGNPVGQVLNKYYCTVRMGYNIYQSIGRKHKERLGINVKTNGIPGMYIYGMGG